MWLCLKLEAMQSDFLLTTTVTITYLDRNLLASTMFTYPCLKLLQAKSSDALKESDVEEHIQPCFHTEDSMQLIKAC